MCVINCEVIKSTLLYVKVSQYRVVYGVLLPTALMYTATAIGSVVGSSAGDIVSARKQGVQ